MKKTVKKVIGLVVKLLLRSGSVIYCEPIELVTTPDVIIEEPKKKVRKPRTKKPTEKEIVKNKKYEK